MIFMATLLSRSSQSVADRKLSPKMALSTTGSMQRLLLGSCVAGALSALTGCAALSPAGPVAQTEGIHGIVHGGQQPISGATIELIAPGTTGYGTAGTVIVSATTDSNGNFTLPRPYTCPANSGLVYIVAIGGNPGAGTNSQVTQAAILGPCSSLTASTYVYISEVTTVAAAYALAPFATLSSGVTNIGTSSTNLLGLTNAAAAAGNLASLSTGQVSTPGTGITVPTAEMNTLADILAGCVNSTTGSTACTSLFSAATPSGGTAPTDTFQAAIDIALNPGNNVSTLYAMATPTSPYQPTLSSTPTDFALGIVYTGGIIGASGGTQGIDIDAQGNAWVSVLSGGRGASRVPSGLLEISPSGVVSPSSSAYINTIEYPQAVAVNSAGQVEVVDNYNQIFEYTPAGVSATSFATNPVSTGSGAAPIGIAIDNNDSSAWIANYSNNTVTHLSNAGSFITASSPLSSGVAPTGIAVNASRDIFATDCDCTAGSPGSNSALTGFFPPSGSGSYSIATISEGSATFPTDVAFDNSGNIWTAQGTGAGENSSTGAQVSPVGGYASNANNVANSIEVDGLGRVFVATNTNATEQPGTLTIFSNSGTLLTQTDSQYGYTANSTIPADMFTPHGMALDASGNVWITGNTPSSVVELIGIAAPVATPLAAQNAPTNRLGVRP